MQEPVCSNFKACIFEASFLTSLTSPPQTTLPQGPLLTVPTPTEEAITCHTQWTLGSEGPGSKSHSATMTNHVTRGQVVLLSEAFGFSPEEQG